MGESDAPRRENSRDWELHEVTSPSQPPCAYCRNKIESATRSVCPRCRAVYHDDCWRTNEFRCAVYGCLPEPPRKESPRREPLPTVVWPVRPVLWGAVFVVVAIALLSVPWISSNENRAGTTFGLRIYAAAQREFRSKDREGKGRLAYWRTDVSGLYALRGGDGRPLGLISLTGALADDRPMSDLSAIGRKAPSHGYWFRAIRHADETGPEPDPDRFAACAFPAKYPSSGLHTFIISQENTVFKKDLGHGRGVLVFPADPEKEGWRRQE